MLLLPHPRLKQIPMPRLLGALLPGPAAELAETLGGQVEDDGVKIAVLAELVARHHVDAAISMSKEDPLGIEDRDAEVVLGLLEQAVHPVDRASGGLGLFVDGDDQKLIVDE